MEHGMQKKTFQSRHQGKSRFWQSNVQKRKAALIIGMNYTDHMNLEPPQVPYRNVEAMAELLRSVYDFDSTVVLSDKEGTPEGLIPTQANIMRELVTFIPSNPRSDYFFVFQGHSSKGTIDAIALNEQREAEYIIPYDGIDPQTDMVDLNRIILDQTLHKFLVADLPPNSQLVAFLDCCHSTTLLDLPDSKLNQIQETKDLGPFSSFLRRIKQSIMTNKRPSSLDRGPEKTRSPIIQSRRLNLKHHRCNNVYTSASWFANSHRFTIADGHFYSSSGPMTINQVPQEEPRQGISDGQFLEVNVIQPKDVHLHKEIHKGKGYRLHVGQNAGKAVMVKVFEGRNAKKTSVETAQFNNKVMHPCFLRMIAAASGHSDLAFLVFSGDYKGSVESIMRVTLLQSLEKSFTLGLQTVIDLSLGLDYLRDINYPVLETDAESFVLLLTHLDMVVISFDPNVSNPSLRRRQIQLDGPELEHSKALITLFSGILQKAFYLPCEEYYRLHEDRQGGEPTPSLTSELNVARPLRESTSEDLQGTRTKHGRLTLERISRDADAILKSFSLDPSLDRQHGRMQTLPKNSRCCRRSVNKVSDCGHGLEGKRACSTKCILSTSRKRCSSCLGCPNHSHYQDGKEETPTEIDCPSSIDPENSSGGIRLRLSSAAASVEGTLLEPATVEFSNPSGRTMIEAVADFLTRDPSPTYRQIMQTAIAHIWLSGGLT